MSRVDSQTGTADWWRKRPGVAPAAERREMASEAIESVRAIERAFAARTQSILDACALYGHSAGFDSVLRQGKAKPLRENVFAQYCDTWVSHIGGQMPRPMWVPIDGDADDLERAKLLVNYTDSMWQRTGLATKRIEAVRDSGLAGIRLIRPYRPRPGAALQLERVHPINIVFDDALGCELPKEIYIRRLVSRSSLISIFPDQRREIEAAIGANRSSWLAYRSTVDAIEVWDCWHIPMVGPDSEDDADDTDGLHILAIDGGILGEPEKWPIPRFPGAFARAIPPTYGYWGNTYFSRMVSIQEELNRMTRMEQEALHTNAIPRIFLSQGSRVLDQHMLDDNIGALIRVSGPAPVFATPGGLGGDVYQRIDRRRVQMSEGWGISQLAATQMKPAGITSEPGFQAYANFQDKRHLFTLQEDAQAQVDLARACVDLERIEYRRNPDHMVPCARGVDGISMIPWPDVALEENNVSLVVMPAGMLPTDMPGKLDGINWLLKMRLIDEQMAQRLLGAPDIQAARSLATAPEDRILKALDGMIRGDKYVAPEPHWDLVKAKVLWALKMNRAEADEVPEPRLVSLRRFRWDLYQLEKRMLGDPASSALGYEPAPPMPLVKGQPQGPVPMPGTIPQAPIAPPNPMAM